MKQLLALVLLLCTTAAASAEPSLAGTWRSDAALSMKYNLAHAKLEERKALFLSQMFGRLTVNFTARTATYAMPDWESQTESGEKHKMVGFKEARSYRRLGGTRSSVAVLTTEPVTGTHTVTVYNFDDPNTMWVYLGGSGKSFPDEHLREYFVRVP